MNNETETTTDSTNHPPATVGRDVHYFDPGYEGGKTPLAAKVIQLEQDPKTIEAVRKINREPAITEVCTLVVFHPKWNAPGKVVNVARSPSGEARSGYWIWPPRV